MCVNIFSNHFIRTFILKAMNIASQIIIDFLYLQLSHKVKTLLYHVNVKKLISSKRFRGSKKISNSQIIFETPPKIIWLLGVNDFVAQEGEMRTARPARRRGKTVQWTVFQCAARESTLLHQTKTYCRLPTVGFLFAAQEGEMRTARPARRRGKTVRWTVFQCAARESTLLHQTKTYCRLPTVGFLFVAQEGEMRTARPARNPPSSTKAPRTIVLGAFLIPSSLFLFPSLGRWEGRKCGGALSAFISTNG